MKHEGQRIPSRSSSPVGAVIVAAGASKRMGQDKIFLDLAGRPVLACTVDVFNSCEFIQQIVVVVKEEHIPRGWELVRRYDWWKVKDVCVGGPRRQDSVKQGLMRLSGCEWVVIHDGARPLVNQKLIQCGLAEAMERGAAIAAVPVKDTLKVIDAEGAVQTTPNRSTLWAVQTPQVFRFDLIKQAYDQCAMDVTDDAMLLEYLGHKVKVFMGSYDNIKITTPEDMVLAECLIKNRESP